MKKSLIPWHVFRRAIAEQDCATLHTWLCRWGFTNDGVVLIGVNVPADMPLQSPISTALDLPAGRRKFAPWFYRKEL